jgi:hypothetical protein
MNLLLPPPLGAAVVTVYAMFLGMPNLGNASVMNLSVAAFLLCYFVGIVPSAIYTVVAELCYRRGLSPNSKAAVAIAAGYGALIAVVGYTYEYGLVDHSRIPVQTGENLRALAEYLTIGVGTGLSVGLILKAAVNRAPAKIIKP